MEDLGINKVGGPDLMQLPVYRGKWNSPQAIFFKNVTEVSTSAGRQFKKCIEAGSEGEEMLIGWGKVREEPPRQKEPQVQNPWGEEESVLQVLGEA